jgi:hypothetical protein
MARVPNTDTFRLQDVVDVINPLNITYLTFTGSGLNDMTVGGTFTGDTSLHYRVQVQTPLTPNDFEWSDDGGSTWDLTGIDMAVTPTNLNNGITVTFGSTTGHTVGDHWDFIAYPDSLDLCFDNAITSRFDLLYEGSKDRLSNFRNYGWALSLVYVESETGGSSHDGIDGNNDFFFTANSVGIISWTISPTGYMTEKLASDYTDIQTYVHVDSTYDIVFSTDSARYFNSWTYDAFGALTRVTHLDTYTSYGDLKSKDPGAITSDGNKFVFVINRDSAFGGNYDDIMVCEFNTTTGALTYKNYYRSANGDEYKDIFYIDGYLFLTSNNNGIQSFTVNQTTGALTLVESGEGAAYYPWGIWCYNGYIYASSATYGMILFSYSSGLVTFVDYDSTYPLIWSVSGDSATGFVYGLRWTTETTRSPIAYRRNTSGIEYACQAGDYTLAGDVWCPPNMTNSIVVITRDDDIRSFELT